MASVEVEDKIYWLEYWVKVRKKRKIFKNGETKLILEKEEIDGIEICGILSNEEMARLAVRYVDELYNKYDLTRKEVLKKLMDFFGVDEQDAKGLLDYAEWYLFS